VKLKPENRCFLGQILRIFTLYAKWKIQSGLRASVDNFQGFLLDRPLILKFIMYNYYLDVE
jgi:hypothetical protein